LLNGSFLRVYIIFVPEGDGRMEMGVERENGRWEVGKTVIVMKNAE
jgi:hypothetical protein